MYEPIRNTASMLDSRDVIARINFLLDTRDNMEPGDSLLPEDAEELAKLEAFAAEGEANAEEWEDGATLIHPDHFATYAQQLADDIGATNSKMSWPLQFIDWEAAADALMVDYTGVEFDGVEYLVR